MRDVFSQLVYFILVILQGVNFLFILLIIAVIQGSLFLFGLIFEDAVAV
jgi:hypothetical protein